MSTAIQSNLPVSSSLADTIRFKFAGLMLGRMIYRASVKISSRSSSLNMTIDHGNEQFFHMEMASDSVLWDMLRNPDPGMGESYMDDKWEMKVGDMGAFLTMLGRGRDQMLASPFGRFLRLITNKIPQKYQHDIDSSYGLIQHHYDIGNELYKTFLDEGMNYSCAFFETPEQSLRDAQLNKMHITIKRLDVKEGMKVLDIGCGWGETCRAISATTGVTITGITLAENQIEYARVQNEYATTQPGSQPIFQPIFQLQDYREHAGNHKNYYDRIVSIGMVEHVGKNNLDEYFKAIAYQLKPGGRALIHSIARSGKPATVGLASPWLIKYIFPGGHIPEVKELCDAAEKQGLKLAAEPFLHGPFHYAETLRRWRQNFLLNFEQLDPEKYDDRFKRMWLFYYCMCEGMFEGCDFHVTQVLCEK